MAVNLTQHREVIRKVFLAGPRAIVKCLARMEEGKKTYEKPGYINLRDYVREAEDEMIDALNYLAMEYVRCNGDDPKRAVLVAAVANAIWQAHIGLQNLMGINGDDP